MMGDSKADSAPPQPACPSAPWVGRREGRSAEARLSLSRDQVRCPQEQEKGTMTSLGFPPCLPPCPVWVGTGLAGCGGCRGRERAPAVQTAPVRRTSWVATSRGLGAGEVAVADVLQRTARGQREAHLSTAGILGTVSPVGSEDARGRRGPGRRLLSAPENFPEGIPLPGSQTLVDN